VAGAEHPQAIDLSPVTAQEQELWQSGGWLESRLINTRSRYRNKYRVTKSKTTLRRRYSAIPRFPRRTRILNQSSAIAPRSPRVPRTITTQTPDSIGDRTTTVHCPNRSVVSSQQSTRVINGRATTTSQVYTNCQ
jgi:hypothetical protein